MSAHDGIFRQFMSHDKNLLWDVGGIFNVCIMTYKLIELF